MKNLIIALFLVFATQLVAQTSKPIQFFSLLKKSEKDVTALIGAPAAKTMVHRGSDSYDGYKYETKNASYSIAFRNGNAFVVVVTPKLKQNLTDDDLFDGGVFDIENAAISGVFKPVQGVDKELKYFGFTTGVYAYTFYGKTTVSKAICY